MSRYKTLNERQASKKASYLPYVLLGYPNADVTLQVCQALIDGGVHGFELGLPFRDPVADGPVIQAAANVALNNGFKIDHAVELVRSIRAMNNDIPLTMMSYYNMVFARDVDRFFKEFADAGLDGILIPDMPPERADEILPIAQKYGLKLIFIAAPNSSEHRLKLISHYAQGFVYVVTRLGITGVDENYSQKLPELFRMVKDNIPLPTIAGFGISEPAHVRQMVEAGADGVIIGSKIVDLIGQGWDGKTMDSSALLRHTKEIMGIL